MRFLFLLVFLFPGISANAQIDLYVDSSVSASGSGSTWSAAYKTLGEALETANTGSSGSKFVINVASGTYYPGGDTSNTRRDTAFCIFRSGITINGGFPSGGGTRDIAANPTILSGNIGNSSSNTDNSSHILVISNVASGNDSIVLSGLEFREAAATFGGTSGYYNSKWVVSVSGAGIYITSVAANCLISECSFKMNQANWDAAAVFVSNSKATFYSCIFEDNVATGSGQATNGGGALNFDNSQANIYKCAFRNCKTQYLGGAIHIRNSQLNKIDSCEFIANSSKSHGGAIFSTLNAGFSSGRIEISNSTFTANRATGSGASGGALYCDATSSHLVRDCRFQQNFAQYDGGAINSSGTVRRSTFDQNSTNASGGGAKAKMIDSCLFTNNKAALSGGALYQSSVSTVSNSQFFLDTAGKAGGAIYTNYRSIISNCTIGKNAAAYGGGIYSDSSNSWLDLDNSVVSGNFASADGGGFYSKKGNYAATSCLFSGNLAIGNGGAIFDSSAIPTIINCTFALDSAKNGNGIYNYSSSPVIKNSIIWEGTAGIFNGINSTPAVTYSIVEGGHSGTGNSSSNPIFINPLPASAIPDTGGVFNIMNCSPAANTGLNSGSYTGLKDLAGNARLFGTIVDRGAFESQTGTSTLITGKSVVCPRDTIRLSNAITGGSWSSSNPAIANVDANGVVLGVSGGTATINYTLSGACANVITKSITVNPAPPIAPIAGKTAVCQRDTIRLSSSVTGGSWSHLQPSIASLSSNGVLQGILPGTDTVLYVTVNSFGCRDTVRSIVTIDSLALIAPITGPSGVCQYGSISLSNATPGGTWSTDRNNISISQTGVVTGLKIGTDSAKYTIYGTGGCFSRVVKLVSVYNLPGTDTISGKFGLCKNDSITLSCPSWGGIWFNAQPSVGAISNSGVYSGSRVGCDTVFYTTVSSHGCRDTVSHPITVDSLPAIAPITGPSSVCLNEIFVMDNITPNGKWRSSSSWTHINFVSALGYVKGLSVGTDTVSYSVTSAGGCRNEVVHVVTVNPLPVVTPVTGPALICVDAPANLTVSTPGGIWSSSDTDVLKAGVGGAVLPVAGGTAKAIYTVTDSNGCSDTSNLTLTVVEVHAAIMRSSTQLTASMAGASYKWLDCDNESKAIPGETAQTFSPKKSGNYAVEIMWQGCADTSQCYSFIPLGIESSARFDQGMQIVPNPASAVATIRLQKPGNYELSLLDPGGRLLHRRVLNGSEASLDLNNYAAGIYFIVVSSATERFTQKLNIAR